MDAIWLVIRVRPGQGRRTRPTPNLIIDRLALDEDDLSIASVSVAEYRAGIELADCAGRAAERARALTAIMSAINVLDYTKATAAHHGRLLAHARRSGAPRGAHDLIIAAHAAETGRSILSRDTKARFGDLPGVSALDIRLIAHCHRAKRARQDSNLRPTA